ncbi:MAG: CCA tRNA nucleotidyltransferase, partial [Cyanobium sp.]
EHAAYGTVELEVNLPAGPLLLDVATARRETYPQPGRNPQVQFARLEDDLARRDFTINAMALLLSGATDADGGAADPLALLDPWGGRADLGDRQLRFLYPLSVRDDPTRVFRGARYAARMGFELAPASQSQLTQTLAEWPWPWRPGDPPGAAPPALGTRLRMELELLLEREAWPLALAALQRWGGLPLLDRGLQTDRHWRRRLHRAQRMGLPLLPSLLATAADPVALAERLQLPHRQHRLLAGFMALRRRLEALADPTRSVEASWQDWGAAGWTSLLEEPGHGAEAVALALAAGVGPRRPLLRWWLRWRHLGPTLTAAELLAQGLAPGPQLGERLQQSRRERLLQERL